MGIDLLIWVLQAIFIMILSKILNYNAMANTYTQCYFHKVFSVKNRDALIKKEWKDE
jgi:hypothetical protein